MLVLAFLTVVMHNSFYSSMDSVGTYNADKL